VSTNVLLLRMNLFALLAAV